MKIIVCGSAQISDHKWISSVLSEYCNKNKVSAIVTGQEDGLEERTVVWAMEKKIKFYIVPTKKIGDVEPTLGRNVDLLDRHKDAKVVLHFKGDSVSEHLCTHALKAKIPVDDVHRL